MIISKTPFRISFFGGGTDYPDWYRRHGGAVLSTTIDKYCYISARFLPPFFNLKHRIVWSHIETVNAISEILHPAVREGLRTFGFDDSRGVEIHHQGDLPARTGIGSSSSFCVGLIKVLTALRGETIDRHALALKAIELEQGVLKENVGSQDQVAAAYGGLNVIRFGTDGGIRVEPMAAPPDRIRALESRLMLVYTGMSRLSTDVAGAIKTGLEENERELKALNGLVDRGAELLRGSGDLDDFGRLLHDGWMLKRKLSPVMTNSNVDRIYEEARKAGALGGKLLGAGSSGFMVFFVPPERQAAVGQTLSHYLRVPFAFDPTGSQLIYEGAPA